MGRRSEKALSSKFMQSFQIDLDLLCLIMYARSLIKKIWRSRAMCSLCSFQNPSKIPMNFSSDSAQVLVALWSSHTGTAGRCALGSAPCIRCLAH